MKLNSELRELTSFSKMIKKVVSAFNAESFELASNTIEFASSMYCNILSTTALDVFHFE